MEGSWSISSSPNKKKFFDGDNTLQIKKEDNVKHTNKESKECIILMQVDNLLTFKQPPQMFLDKKTNIKHVHMFGVKHQRGYFNEGLQHLRENLHI